MAARANRTGERFFVGLLCLWTVSLWLGCRGSDPEAESAGETEEALAAPIDVPITVKEVAGTGLAGFPTSVVVPLPYGAQQSVDGFRLLGPDGKAVPAQIQVLNRWWAGDGSLRHVQVHFQPTLPASAADSVEPAGATYRLVSSGPKPAPVRAVEVSQTAEAVAVDTGPLRFTVKKRSGFNVLDEVWLDSNGDGTFAADERLLAGSSGAVLTPTATHSTGPQRDAARDDLTVTVEEAGPIRAVVKVEARTRFTSAADLTHGFAVRIYAWAGQPFVKVDYQVQNAPTPVASGAPLYVESLELPFKLALQGEPTVTIGNGDGTAYQRKRGAGLQVAQSYHDTFAIQSLDGATTLASGKNADGYLDVRDGRHGVTAMLKDFWESYPNGLAVSADNQLVFQLLPAWGGERYWSNPKPTFYWLHDMQASYKEALLYFHDGKRTPQELATLRKTFQFPPVGSVPKAWYAQSRATLDLGGVVPAETPQPKSDPLPPNYPAAMFEKSDNYNFSTQLFRVIDPQRINSTAAGGGWPYASARYVLTGRASDRIDVAQWEAGELNTRPHWLPGYTYAADFAATRLGMQQPFSTESFRSGGNRGPYLANTGPYAFPRDEAHAWYYHVADGYYVSGNPWTKDWFGFIGELRKGWLGSNLWGPSRGIGHVIAGAVDAYKVTGDATLLQMIRDYVNQFLRKDQSPRFGYRDSRCCGKAGEAAFQAGYLCRAVINYMEEIRRSDPQAWAEAFQFLSGYMAWNLNYSHFAYYTEASKGELGTSDPTSLTMVDPQAWYYLHTGKREYWEQLERYIQRADGGQGSYGDFTAWWGQYEARYYQYAKQHPKQDTVPPEAVRDLAPALAKDGKLTVTFTAPAEGARYHVVYGDKPLSDAQTSDATKLNWWAAQVKAALHQGAARSRQRVEVALPEGSRGKTLYVAVLSFDKADNLSALSNVGRVTVP